MSIDVTGFPFTAEQLDDGRLRARFDDMKPVMYRLRAENIQPYPPV